MTGLSDTVINSYSSLITSFKIRIEDILKTIRNEKPKGDALAKLKDKVTAINGWIKETNDEERFIRKHRLYLDSLHESVEKVQKIFSYQAKINTSSLEWLDNFTLVLALSSGSTPTLIKGYRSSHQKFNYIKFLTGSMKAPRIQNFDGSMYCWDPSTNRSTQTGNRYLTTCSYNSLDRAIKSNSNDKVAVGVLKLLQETTCQSRYGNIWQQIIKFLFVQQIESSSEFYSNLPNCVPKSTEKISATSTHSFQAIIDLLEPYTYVPFRVKQGRLVVNEQNVIDWPTTLPVILSILINGVIMELTGVLDDEAAQVYVTHMLTACKSSIVDYLLYWKSKFRKWTKIGISKAKRLALLTWEDDKPGKIIFSTGLHEIFLTDEREGIMKQINEYPHYYKEYVKRMLSNIDSLGTNNVDGVHATLLLRHYFMTAHTISCGSNYNKTAPALSLDDAYGTRVNTVAKTGIAKSYIHVNGVKMAVKYSWDHIGPIYFDVRQEIISLILNCVKDESFINLESGFVKYLTNRSGGVKYLENQRSLPGIQINQTIQQVSQTRIINFLLTAPLFRTLDGIKELALPDTVAGYREQVDRRMRVIAIVKNVMQLLSLPLLVAFNDVKDDTPEVAMGKQVGNILDALNQIRASGRKDGFMTSSDVAGMDASVLKSTAKFVRHTIIDALDQKGIHINKLFAFNESVHRTSNIDDDGNMVEQDESISTLKFMSAFLEHLDGMSTIVAKDGYFTSSVYPSIQTFKSGEFFTSGNHTTLLYAITKVVLRSWGQLKSSFSTLGDDFFLWMTNAKDPNQVIQFLNNLKDSMAQFNLVLELEGSRFYGDFLQQSAFCGIYVPKPARSTIENVERNEVLDRNPVDIMSSLIDTSNVTLNRVYSQNNLKPIIRSIWFIIRTKRYITTRGGELSKIKSNYKGNLVTQFGNSLIYLTLPLLMISVSPIGYPPILLSGDLNEYEPISVLTPSGDFMYNFWYGVFCHKEMTYTLDADTTKSKLTGIFFTKNINWKARDEAGITLSEYIMGFNRNTASKDFKKSLIGVTNLSILERALLQYADQGKLQRSQEAVMKLEQNQIHIPAGITYEGRERAKVLLSFSAKLESLDERTYLDEKLVDYYTRYQSIPTYNQKKLLFNTFRVMKVPDGQASTEFDVGETAAGVFKVLPIIPACHLGSDLLKLAIRFGFPSSHDMHVTKSISRLGESVGFGFDAERAVMIGLKVLKQNYSLLDTYITTLGLNSKEHQDFKNVVLRLAAEGFSHEYQSIFAFNKYFITNGDGSYYSAQLDYLKSLRVKSVLSPNIVSLLARDYYFAFAKHANEYTLGLICCYANWLHIASTSSAILG